VQHAQSANYSAIAEISAHAGSCFLR
jgi:hypothetical protein